MGIGLMLGLAAANAGLNTGGGILSQLVSSRLNEKAAQRADLRGRQLYHDLESPAAQVAQLKQAGLSPALLYAKGGVGGSASAGAQAAPATNQIGNVFDLMQAKLLDAQIKNINADTNKKNAETEGTKATTKKTDAEIQNLLEQNGLIKLNKDYQALCNDIKTYEKVFAQETTETNIAIQERTLENLTSQGKKLAEEAKTAGADAIVAQSTIDARIIAATQQVAINKMQLAAMKSNIRLNDATIEKIKADIFNNAEYLKLTEAKNEQEIEKIKQDMINNCEKILMEQHDLDRKDKEFVWSIIEGAFNIFNRSASNTIGLVKVAGDIATK